MKNEMWKYNAFVGLISKCEITEWGDFIEFNLCSYPIYNFRKLKILSDFRSYNLVCLWGLYYLTCIYLVVRNIINRLRKRIGLLDVLKLENRNNVVQKLLWACFIRG